MLLIFIIKHFDKNEHLNILQSLKNYSGKLKHLILKRDKL